MKIIGVTMGYDGKPHLCFEGGQILWGNADRILYPEYFKNGDYPTDPVTKEKLPIANLKKGGETMEWWEIFSSIAIVVVIFGIMIWASWNDKVG